MYLISSVGMVIITRFMKIRHLVKNYLEGRTHAHDGIINVLWNRKVYIVRKHERYDTFTNQQLSISPPGVTHQIYSSGHYVYIESQNNELNESHGTVVITLVSYLGSSWFRSDTLGQYLKIRRDCHSTSILIRHSQSSFWRLYSWGSVVK